MNQIAQLRIMLCAFTIITASFGFATDNAIAIKASTFSTLAICVTCLAEKDYFKN